MNNLLYKGLFPSIFSCALVLTLACVDIALTVGELQPQLLFCFKKSAVLPPFGKLIQHVITNSTQKLKVSAKLKCFSQIIHIPPISFTTLLSVNEPHPLSCPQHKSDLSH